MQLTYPRCGRRQSLSVEDRVCDYCRRIQNVYWEYEWTLITVAFIVAAILIYVSLPDSPS